MGQARLTHLRWCGDDIYKYNNVKPNDIFNPLQNIIDWMYNPPVPIPKVSKLCSSLDKLGVISLWK